MKILFINNGEPLLDYPFWAQGKLRKWYRSRKVTFSTGEKRFPIGLGYLSAVLKEKGHEVFLLDRFADPGAWVDPGVSWDFVGVYASTPLFEDTLAILERLKGTKAKVAVGGPHVTVSPRTIPDWVDYVVQGEGEYVINDLVEGKWPSGVLLRTPRVKDLDAVPRADYDLFLDRKRSYEWSIPFTKHQPIFLMNTSRSCPYRCTFCDVRDIWGKLWTKQSPERVVDDMKYLKRTYNIAGVYFREDIFTADKNRVRQICELLIKEKLGLVWAAETRVDCGSARGMLELMAKAGCVGVYVGAEHFSERMLDIFKKDITPAQIVETCRLAKQFGIVVAMSLIIEHPEENAEDRKKMKKGLEETKPEIVWKNRYRPKSSEDTPNYPEFAAREMIVIEDVPGVWYGQKDRMWPSAHPSSQNLPVVGIEA
jgi:radical SAM superfamily enzyme YgiQ (UPF0313 family)